MRTFLIPIRVSRCTALLSLAALFSCVETTPIEWAPESFGTQVRVLEDSKELGRRGFIGVEVEENQSDSLESLEYFPGVRVVDVVENSPADEIGLRVNDVILSANEMNFDTREGFQALLDEAPAGSKLELEVERFSEVLRYEVSVLDSTPNQDQGTSQHHIERTKLRAKFRTVAWTQEPHATPQGTAVEIIEVFERSPLLDNDIDPGDLLLSWDGERLESGPDLIRRLQGAELGQTIEVLAVDNGEIFEAEVELWEPDRALTYFRVPILFTYEHDPPQDSKSFALIDLFLFSLFSYKRDGLETHYRFLSLFGFSSGEGELAEIDEGSR